MKMILRLSLLLCVLLVPSMAIAHFHMLLPDKSSPQAHSKLRFVYQWGHPFEHELFDAARPEDLFVVSPSGKKTDLLKELEQIEVPAADKKRVKAWQFDFRPPGRGKEIELGDYVFALRAPRIWMADNNEFWQDFVKVIVHVEAQKGWDQAAGLPFELVPLTRPYGLTPGMVFQARALHDHEPVANAYVEVERYNALPPPQLPPEEQRTRVVKTDPNGILTCSLTDPGWWCITAYRDAGTAKREGKEYPVRQRTTLWVFVEEKK